MLTCEGRREWQLVVGQDKYLRSGKCSFVLGLMFG